MSALMREKHLVEIQAIVLVERYGILAEMKLIKALIEEIMKQAVTLINEEMDITAIGIEDPLIDRSRQEILKNPERIMIKHLHLDLKAKEKRKIEAELEPEPRKAHSEDLDSDERLSPGMSNF